MAGDAKTPYDIIFVDEGIGRAMKQKQRLLADALLQAFDTTICQIASDGVSVGCTDGYKRAVAEKRIVQGNKNNVRPEHLQRIAAKYPDFTPDEAVAKAVKPYPYEIG